MTSVNFCILYFKSYIFKIIVYILHHIHQLLFLMQCLSLIFMFLFLYNVVRILYFQYFYLQQVHVFLFILYLSYEIYMYIYVYVTLVGIAYYTIENHCSFHYCFNSLKLKWSVFFTIRLLSAKHLKRFFQHIHYYVQVLLTPVTRKHSLHCTFLL